VKARPAAAGGVHLEGVAMMRRWSKTGWAVLAFGLCVFAFGRAREAYAQARGVEAVHRSGQTFITWPEVGKPAGAGELTWGGARRRLAGSKVTYRILAHDRPITAQNVHAAHTVGQVGALSGWNLNGRNVEALIGQAMIRPDEPGELARNYNGLIYRWHMDHPRMDRYRLSRFVIDEKAGPLAAGTGLYVHSPREAGRRHYAVVAVRGAAEAHDFTWIGATAGPVTETVGPGEPICQGDGLWGPFYDYPGRRRVYVQWTGPPLSPRQNMYFNWSVLVPPDAKKPAPVELYFHDGNYSYAKPNVKLLARSIQIAPHDWPFSGWYGFHEGYGGGGTLGAGRVANHTQRRIAAFLDWAARRLPIDPDRVIAVGGDGAAMMALAYPDRFAYVLITGFQGDRGGVLDAKMADRYAAAWGPKGPRITDAAGRGQWAWAELDKLVAASGDLPLFVCKGRSWGGVKGWGKGRGRFYTALKAAGQPLHAHWAWGGKLTAPDKWTGLWRGLDLTRTTPVPAFANSSVDAEGEGRGQTNSVYSWKNVQDTPEAFEITLTGPVSTFDLTLRRLGRFGPRASETLQWQAKSLPGRSGETAPVQRGTVVVADGGLVTLTGLKLTGGGLVVRITRSR
jgi:hypothetical protein